MLPLSSSFIFTETQNQKALKKLIDSLFLFISQNSKKTIKEIFFVQITLFINLLIVFQINVGFNDFI